MVILVAEIWKDIEGYEGVYMVSNIGRVKSLDRALDKNTGILRNRKGIVFKEVTTTSGYKTVGLSKNKKHKSFKINNLVAQAFIPNPNNKTNTIHINRDKSDNCVENIKWSMNVKSLSGETWKDIENYEGVYQVSDLGRVKSLERYIVRKNGYTQLIYEKVLNPCINTHGYLALSLHKNNKSLNCRVHRLMAEAFIPRIKGKNIINHINGIKTDNRLKNLEWTDYSGNLIHAYDTGLNNSRNKTKVVNLENNKEYTFKSMKAASLFMGEGKWYVSYHHKYNKNYKNEKYKWELI